MLLGGLWHGVGVTFVAWGALHGVALALHKIWMRIVPGAKAMGRDMSLLRRGLATVLTFNLVAFGWLLFTAEDMNVVEDMLLSIVNNFSTEDVWAIVEANSVAFGLMLFGYLLHALPRSADDALRRAVIRIGFVGQWVVLVVTIWLVMECGALLSDGSGAGLPMYAAF